MEKSWQAGLNYLVSNIDNKYFNKRGEQTSNLCFFTSPLYYLADANFVDPGTNTHFKF